MSVTCTISALGGEHIREDLDRFEFGTAYRVLIVPLLPGAQTNPLWTIAEVQVYEGRRLVAQGRPLHVCDVSESTWGTIQRLLTERP